MIKKLILKKSLLVAGILYIPGVRSTLHGSSGKGPIHCSGLAGIPTAGDVTQEGIRPGEMSRLLMQKIEELTCYIILSGKWKIGLVKPNRTARTYNRK